MLTFFYKVSGEEAESINLEKLTLDEVRFDVILENVVPRCAVKESPASESSDTSQHHGSFLLPVTHR